MTLSDLLTALTQDLGYDAIPSPVVTARLTRYLNEGLRHILSMNEMGPLRSDTLPFVSAAGQKTYGLPQTFVSIDQIVDTTNNIRLRLMTQDQFRTIDPQEVSSGTPTHYVPLGFSPVARQPPETGSAVWVQSANAIDTTQIVSMQGLRRVTLGVVTAPPVSVTLTGTTPVQVGPLADYVVIQQLTVSAPTAGLGFSDFPVTGNVLAIIAGGALTVQYQVLRLWPTPAGIYTYHVDGPLVMSDLTATSDIPVIPADFQLILADYARMREYEYRDDSRFPMAQLRYDQKWKALRDRIIDPPDFKPRVGRMPDRSSNLGSFYPPGRF